MADTALNIAMHSLRRTLLRPGERGRTDAELLEAFVARRNESSFEAILDRHGPMVLGLCRRILRNEADAEDAYQATFLVLVRKAGSIRPRGMLGNWLYGVANTTALKALAMKSKRTAKERAAAARPKDNASESSQLLDLLDRELNTLPDIYRAAIVLCDLEGKSIKDAAQQLGCPQGTMASRVGRGRALLARRLSSHGVAFSGAAIASALGRQVTAAAVSPVLMKSTVDAAMHFAVGHAAAVGALSSTVVTLSEGVLKTMLISKLKFATATILTVVLGTSATMGLLPNQGDSFAIGSAAQSEPNANQAVAERALPFVANELDFFGDDQETTDNIQNAVPRRQLNPSDKAKVAAWVNGRPIFENEITLQIKINNSLRSPGIAFTFIVPPSQRSLPQQADGMMPLTVEVKALPNVKLGQALDFEVIISNKGKATLKEIWLYGKLPVGISHPEGAAIGALLPALGEGETKTYKMSVTAVQPGRHTVEIRVTAEPPFQERVARPVVTVEVDGDENRKVEYNRILTQTIELEIAYQDAVQKLEAGNPKALTKLKELVNSEFEKQIHAFRKTVPDDQYRALAPAFRRQLERQFIGMEYIRSRAFSEVNMIGNQEVKEFYDTHLSELEIPLEAVEMQIRNKLRNQVFEREYKRIIRELKSRAVVEIERWNIN